MTAPYVVFDRDGTLIEHVPYLSSPTEVRLLPTVVAALRLLQSTGSHLFLHTNQSGVGRGYFTEGDAFASTDEMVQQIALGSDLFERVCTACEAPGDVRHYRKPSPRFGRELMEEYGIGASQLYYIGDSIVDLDTALALGCNAIGVNTGEFVLRDVVKAQSRFRNVVIYDTLLEAAEHVVAAQRAQADLTAR